MFRFGDLGRVIWPVTIGDDTFRVDFAIYSRKELMDIRQKGSEAALARLAAGDVPKTADEIRAIFDTAARRNDAAEADLRQRVKGWYDVEDPQGQPLTFSGDRLQALLDTDYGFTALLTGLMEASRAGPAKNSQPGPGGMPVRDQA